MSPIHKRPEILLVAVLSLLVLWKKCNAEMSPFPAPASPMSSDAKYYEEHWGKWERNYDCDKLKGECREINKPCPKLPEGTRITCEKKVMQWRRHDAEKVAQYQQPVRESNEQTYRSITPRVAAPIVPPIIGLSTVGAGYSKNPHRRTR